MVRRRYKKKGGKVVTLRTCKSMSKGVPVRYLRG